MNSVKNNSTTKNSTPRLIELVVVFTDTTIVIGELRISKGHKYIKQKKEYIHEN